MLNFLAGISHRPVNMSKKVVNGISIGAQVQYIVANANRFPIKALGRELDRLLKQINVIPGIRQEVFDHLHQPWHRQLDTLNGFKPLHQLRVTTFELFPQSGKALALTIKG